MSGAFINFNPSLDKQYMPNKVWNEITDSFQIVNGCSVEVLGWISNLIPHLIMDVTTYPCSDLS